MSKLIYEGTNAEYHADKTHLSSSSIKLLLKDPQQFYRENILGQREERNTDFFTEGNVVHALILEPDKVIERYAVYPGLKKAGAAYEAFKLLEDNQQKAIISAAQMMRCQGLLRAYEALPVAKKLMEAGLAEHTMTSVIMDVPVKARADYINIERQVIVDVKTTSMPSDKEYFRATVVDYGYELSAALYKQIAEQVYNVPFDFYWLVLSKSDQQAHVYKASEATLADGRAKVVKGLHLYKKCKETGIWQLDQPAASYDTSMYEIEEV
jgi:PDDEXK-like domain of unknown function (DUF3799)